MESPLTREGEIQCHKARIFSVLAKAPVVRAWTGATCDGAVFLGDTPLPTSYADRYFRISKKDISYVPFSIAIAFDVTVPDDNGQEIPRYQWNMSLAQIKASEFLIVTFPGNHDRIALLPHRLYRPIEEAEKVEEDGSAERKDVSYLLDEISRSIWQEYSFSITLLLANIEEIRRITANPMHPTTTPFQIGLDGIIPKADFPKAIMPQGPGQINELHAERKLRTIHRQFPWRTPEMTIDFLEYQPLMRDFKLVISRCEPFPSGLEAVINYGYGHSRFPNDDDVNHLRYADYLLTQGIRLSPQYLCSDRAFFIPRQLIPEAWFKWRPPHEHMPKDLFKSGWSVSNEEFMFDMDGAGRWCHDIWRIIIKYPPGRSPTPAEKRQDLMRKAFPWPEIEAQVALQKDLTPQKVRKENEQPPLKRDSGTGGKDAVKPSDVSLLAAHYMARSSLDDNEAEEDG